MVFFLLVGWMDGMEIENGGGGLAIELLFFAGV